MLPETKPDELTLHWPTGKQPKTWEYGRDYSFPFLPLGFFPSFVCTVMHLAELKPVLFWRNGLLVRAVEEQAALVLFDPENYSLSIRIRMSHCAAATATKSIPPDKLLLHLLVDVVEYQIDGKYKLDHVDRFVPCTHCLSSNDATMFAAPFQFTFVECTKAALEGHEFLFCQHIRSAARCVLLRTLAPDIAFHGIASSFALIEPGGELKTSNEGESYTYIRLNRVLGKGGYVIGSAQEL
jgi:hypothetical protein